MKCESMKKTIYALGVFDGVHVGHAQLLRQCHALSRVHGCLTGAVTFGTHPDTQVFGKAPVLINTLGDRERLLKHLFSMDAVVVLPFDERMRAMPWQDFLEMLERDHGAAGFVCGEDFCFGNRGQGTARLLADYCQERQLPWGVVPEQSIDGIRVSSTYIRQLLEQGEMETAVRFLGHPHILTGRVEPGGVLPLPEGLAVPKEGDYAAAILLDQGGLENVARVTAGNRIRLSGPAGAFTGREITLALTRFLG